MWQQTNEKNKLDLVAQHLSGYAPTELATLSNYPIGPAASGGSNHNQLYLSSTVCNSDAELVSLSQIPQVQRKQLDIMGPLGSGAFGNVHEGLVHHLNGQIEKVAIKVRLLITLRLIIFANFQSYSPFPLFSSLHETTCSETNSLKKPS